MLPKNRMRTFRLDKLKIFPEAEHAFEGLDMVRHVSVRAFSPPPAQLAHPHAAPYLALANL